MSSAARPKRLKHSAEADHHSAGGRLLIAFSLESLIGLAPEWVIGFPPES
jgi:hypothetical protein